jgi:tetratricopeptide (TPR) repeat protein
VTELLALAGLALWALGMAAAGRLEWRSTSVDRALAFLVLLVLVQLALGPGPLVAWALGALGPGPGEPPDLPRAWWVGTVSRDQTWRSLLLFLTYAATYVLAVQVVRRRRQLRLLVRGLLGLGGALALAGVLDYAARGALLGKFTQTRLGGRLAATFANPDHFAVWLAMLICLGVGDLLARADRGPRAAMPLARALRSREAREDLIRRYLPFVGLGLMAAALVFTLSRGGILALLGALAVVLAVSGALGRMRWTLVLVGALLVVVLALGAWIGLDPILRRFEEGTYRHRLVQATSSLGMLRAFPLLGVGLGAYRDVYPRYQPAELSPGKVSYPHAHDDWLQLAAELGAAGALIALWACWRGLSDLLGAHLLGRGRCPVGAGEDHGARRHDPVSVGLGIGGLAAAIALALHSLVDFGARIPANGVLAATCLAIATVALHTRFGPGGGRVLSRVRARDLPPGRAAAAALAVLALGVSLAGGALVVWRALADHRVSSALASDDLARAEELARRHPRDPEALRLASQRRLGAAERAWSAGLAPDGRLLATWDERRAVAAPLIAGGVAGLQAAIAGRPTDPSLQERLAWTHAAAAVVEGDRAAEHRGAALAAMGRAIALAPQNPRLQRSLALIAAAEPGPRADVALAAARRAIAGDPGLLADLAARLLPLAPSRDAWLSLVPPTAERRLLLGGTLESLGLDAEATEIHRAAADLGGPAEPAARWLAARILLRAGDHAAAAREVAAALARDADNPELHLAMAQALAAAGDPDALEAFQRAVTFADARWQHTVALPLFAAAGPPVQGLIERRLGPAAEQGPVRYRRALGQHLLDRRLWQPARRVWDEVLAERPGDAAAHFARGVALAGIGVPGEALEAFRRAVVLDGRTVAYRLRLADLLWAGERYHEAMEEWRRVIALEPGRIEARLRLAGALRQAGQWLEAIVEYQRVLQIAPDDPVARRALGRDPGR